MFSNERPAGGNGKEGTDCLIKLLTDNPNLLLGDMMCNERWVQIPLKFPSWLEYFLTKCFSWKEQDDIETISLALEL